MKRWRMPFARAARHPESGASLHQFVLHVIVPLVTGVALYVCFRPMTVELFDWTRRGGLDAGVRVLRRAAHPIGSRLPEWAIYSLGDGLWCYAATSTALLLWRDATHSRAARAAIPHAGLALACGLEWLQWHGTVPGTADLTDVLLFCAGDAAACLMVSAPTSFDSHTATLFTRMTRKVL